MARQTVMTRRAVAAATAGSTIEFYDFLLYGVVAALVFPEVFFPRQNPYAGVLLSFSTYFIGFCARPIGAANLRPLRRPNRAEADAGHHHADHGRRYGRHRAHSAVPRHRPGQCLSPRRLPAPPGARRRRGVGRSQPPGHWNPGRPVVVGS